MNPRVDRSPGDPGRSRIPALAALAVATLALATACGSSSHPAAASASTAIQPGGGQSLAGAPGATATGPLADGTAMPSMTMPTATGSSGAPAAPVAGNAVAIKGFAFSPAALSVKVGTTVTWTNQDSDAHTVTSQGSGGPLNSAALATGQTYSYTFTKPGTYSYLCTIHPFMTATVTVTP
ncbi:blue (type 1) copper domain protein [Catenulispora acidiphila DSM 44928]|uniref:Blue (Type 1) copper domain protein n=1 Tax=Catenulispora acidiphila (strain DSM 44928 / JCM 14897 / NBRC 102108 / NRRL B-24433 / ID139908) TaxID=479433 RepID=C7PXJ0_CATAD|nr:cupredoxin family copper-binding protein [Catenulispora acidiphila]ACU71443.1 blue (type 1) copper domain protein [Catenulispora acidiphila DSM 44928]